VTAAGRALDEAGGAAAELATVLRAPEPESNDPTLAALVEQGEQAIKSSQFNTA
jgi:hypothetical protein